MNKTIKREKDKNEVYGRRTLETDYRHLKTFLRPGMRVLDVGCATGSITKGIADCIGKNGEVIGIDNTSHMIDHGNEEYASIPNLHLECCDLFSYEPEEKFDLVVAARVIQWMDNPIESLIKIKSLLKPNGQVSILDYNHNRLEWVPQPPLSMLRFYQAFLKWKSDAGMNNAIGSDLPHLLKQIGFKNIEVINSNEYYNRTRADFKEKVKIWSDVADLEQISEEGYMSTKDRKRAKEEYNHWVDNNAISMTMFLNEVRGHL